MKRWRELHKRFRDSVSDSVRDTSRDTSRDTLEPCDSSVLDSLFIELELLIIEDEQSHNADQQPAALECIRFLLADYGSTCSIPRKIRALIRAARWTDRKGFLEISRTLYQQILDLTDSHDDWHIQSLEELGELHRRSGDLDQAIACQQKAAELAQSCGAAELEAHALNNLGVVEIERGCLAKAGIYLEKALECLETAPEPLLEGHIYNNLGVICCINSQPAAGIAQFNRALFFRDQAGDRNGFAETLHNMGLAYIDMDRLDDAEDYLDRALGMVTVLGRVQSVVNIQLAKSELFLKRKEAVIAGRIASEAMEGFRQLGDKLGMADALRLQAEAEFLNGHTRVAHKMLREALEVNKQCLHLMGEAQCNELLYRIALSENALERAESHRKEAIETWTKLGNESAVARLESLKKPH